MEQAVAGPETDAFLGVADSFSGRSWRARAVDERRALALCQRFALPDPVGRAMAGRGVTPEDAENFLNPTLRAHLPDPSTLRDMDAAVARLVRALRDGERIAIFGDYDVDGAASCALLSRVLQAVGCRPTVYIPDRVAEGYGPNAEALRRLAADGHTVLLTVDCGITAFDPLAAAAEAGMDVIVLDHHVAEPRLPHAVAVVNPNRLDEDGGLGHLAACGVAFLLAVALNRALRAAGWYGAERPEPDLRAWLDLVALGTVCDVVPLVGLNRAFVAQGLRVMARRANPGLVALADAAGLDERPTAYHLGFVLGPRINAGGRVGEAGLGAALLAGDDPDAAQRIAARLDAHNAERKAIEADVLDAAQAQAEAQAADGAPVIVAAGAGWHPGVVGIVASRLVERFHRPAFVVGLEDGVGKGSGRSIKGVDLGGAIIAARQAGLLLAGGGHAMAGGFTVAADRLEALRAALAERVVAAHPDGLGVPTYEIDAAVRPEGATTELVAALERLAPFGMGNPQPRFALPAVRAVRADVVGQGHVRCVLAGEGAGGGRLKGIAFRAADAPLGAGLLKAGSAPLHVAGTLRPDRWQGRDDVQLVIEDAASAL